tara:strand:+ start:375 stop:695 length:321 start_codon:yes stop_codon:yes gene_type:complete
MEEKTAIEVKEMIESKPSIRLIDVREQWEYDTCHIENSVHIPMGKIVESIELFTKSEEYVIVCHHGIRSRTVALYLEQNGIDKVYNLNGGIDKWSDDVDPNLKKYK